jgi:hypothetical protein
LSAPPTGVDCRRGDLLGCWCRSVLRATLAAVEVTAAEVARVPAANLRARRAEFGAVWAAAERLNRERAERRAGD